jgi:tetratricopeptide (TPR) repeat protein
MKTLYNFTLLCALLFSASIIFAQNADREKGIDLYNNGEYQKAVETLKKVVETDEKDQKSWLYLGMSQAKLKNKSQAAKAFKKADNISNTATETDKTQTGVKIISKPRAGYTDAARASQTQGTIKLAVEFGADGDIKAVFPFQTLPDGLTENCVESVKKIKFEPATKDGKAYSVIKIISYSFTIY